MIHVVETPFYVEQKVCRLTGVWFLCVGRIFDPEGTTLEDLLNSHEESVYKWEIRPFLP